MLPGSFTYTATGNDAVDDRGAQDDLTFTSNAANRLASIASPSGTLATMVYNGLGRRTTRQEGSATARYHYDGEDRLIAISDDSGNWTETIWLEDLPVAQASGSSLVAIHTDQIGQPVRMTNSSGAIVWSRTAQPFGETYAESGAIATVLRFPGQVADATTQTHYNMARDYDPSLGRYLQSDPIGIAGGLNTYVYALNNPTALTDPSGNFPIVPIILGAIEIYSAVTTVQTIIQSIDTLLDPCATDYDKAMAGTDIAMSVLPGSKFLGGSRVARDVGKRVGREGIEVAALRISGPVVGGGAKLENLSAREITRIQNAANRTGTPITVVGSRANGTARANSDWDFVLPEGTPRTIRHSLTSSLPEGPKGLGEPRNQDFFLTPLDPTKPHIIFPPKPR